MQTFNINITLCCIKLELTRSDYVILLACIDKLCQQIFTYQVENVKNEKNDNSMLTFAVDIYSCIF